MREVSRNSPSMLPSPFELSRTAVIGCPIQSYLGFVN